MFTEALLNGDILIPDGAGIVLAFKILRCGNIQRIAGWDLFQFEMKEPKRMWRRYIIGNVRFIGYIIGEFYENKMSTSLKQ